MAKELNVPVIALSQLRRIQSKEPQISDLRESGAIEQDADIVMFINRPEATATAEEMESGKIVKGAAELIIAKHRNGSQGRVQLKFIGESTKFAARVRRRTRVGGIRRFAEKRNGRSFRRRRRRIAV